MILLCFLLLKERMICIYSNPLVEDFLQTFENYFDHSVYSITLSYTCLYTQSRSSLYAEYTSCVGPPKHQGAPLALKDVFILVLFLRLASGYENMNDQLF